MNRFFGLMPSSEIEKKANYVDKNNLKVTIMAGKNGWSIIWADDGSTWRDIESSADANFTEAYNEAVAAVGELTPVNHVAEDVCYNSEC